MVRAKRRRDQDAGPGERTHGPGRRPEGRDRHVPARDIEKTHADGRFEIGGVSRETIEAISSRRAEIEAAMEGRGHGATAENQHLARRAALMTREHKREVDREALRGIWEKQASELGLESKALVASAAERALHDLKKEGAREAGGDISPGTDPAKEAVEWALAHLSERYAVFARTDILAAALAHGSVSIGALERVVGDHTREGRVHDAPALKGGDGLTTDVAATR